MLAPIREIQRLEITSLVEGANDDPAVALPPSLLATLVDGMVAPDESSPDLEWGNQWAWITVVSKRA